MVKDINSLGLPPNSGTRTNSNEKATGNEPAPSTAAGTESTATSDQVKLSSQVDSLKAAEEALQSLPEVNEDRVAEVKAALANNSYNIDNQRLAEKMLSTDSLF